MKFVLSALLVPLASFAIATANSSPADAKTPRDATANISMTNVAPFSMIVTSNSTGLIARCEFGCHWTEVSIRCTANCDAVIDAYGIAPRAAALPSASAFAFELTSTNKGLRAVSRAGTAWTSLGWNCGGDVCRARLNGSGVSTRPFF